MHSKTACLKSKLDTVIYILSRAASLLDLFPAIMLSLWYTTCHKKSLPGVKLLLCRSSVPGETAFFCSFFLRSFCLPITTFSSILFFPILLCHWLRPVYGGPEILPTGSFRLLLLRVVEVSYNLLCFLIHSTGLKCCCTNQCKDTGRSSKAVASPPYAVPCIAETNN